MQLLKLARLAKGLNLEGCQPFVFSTLATTQTQIPVSGDKVLASPFPVFSIEMDRGSGAVAHLLTTSEEGINIACVLCRELAPDDYEFHLLIELPNKEARTLRVTADMPTYVSILDLVHVFLDRLYTDKGYDTSYGGHAKYKDSQGVNRKYKPSNVIYLRPSSSEESTLSGRKLTPREKWAVRSHWRKIKPTTNGLDRLGNRTVPGRTWVGSYEKGVGKLTPKIRKVTR